MTHLRLAATYLCVFVVLLSVPAHAAGTPTWVREYLLLEGCDDWQKVFGRFHMALIHFPIGLLAAAGMVQLFAPNREPRPGNSILVCLGLGAGSALLALWTGWVHQAAEPVRDSLSQTVFLHRWLGVFVASASSLAFLLALWARKSGGSTVRRFYQLLLALSVGTVLLNGHLGGSLVHGEGYLWRPLQNDATSTDEKEVEPIEIDDIIDVNQTAPDPANVDEPGTAPDSDANESDLDDERSGALPSSGDTRVAYAEASEVLKSNCTECHGAETQKAGLRLDTPAELRVWPELLSVGAPADSELLARVRLPLGHEDHMPPDVELASTEMQVLVDWVEAGAPGI